MEPGDVKVNELRRDVLQLFLYIASALSLVLVPMYAVMGVGVLAYASGAFLVLNALLAARLYADAWSQERCANIFLGATLAMLMLGLAVGTETLDNKPWQLLFPIIVFVISGARRGVYWCVAYLLAALAVFSAAWPAYEPMSVVILLVAHITASCALYVFILRNEDNIRAISRESHTDPLTNTYNRQLFEQLSSNEVNRARRAEEPLAIYMIDIDHFKKYNDRYGHPAGDRALRNVARVIRRSARRASDLVFRYGGEEFCIVSSGTSRSDAHTLADSIIGGVRELQIRHEDAESDVLTVSIGLAYREHLDGYSAESLLKSADDALYSAKSGGRDRLILHVPAANERDFANVGT